MRSRVDIDNNEIQAPKSVADNLECFPARLRQQDFVISVARDS